MRHFKKLCSSACVIPGTLFLFIFLTYLLTWHGFLTGYENETAHTAKDWLLGNFHTRRAGPMAILMYLPFAVWGKLWWFAVTDRFLSVVPVFYAALWVVALYGIGRKLFGVTKIAVGVAVLLAFGSVIWPYANAGMEYQAGLLLAVLLWTLLEWAERRGALWWPSLALAALVAAKSYGLLIFVPYILFIFLTLRAQNRQNELRHFRFWVQAILAPVGLLACTFFANWLMYGRISGAYSLAHEFQVWQWWEGFYGIFFSAGKNIFLYSPILLLTLVYWQRFWHAHRPAAVFVCVAGLLFVAITTPFSYWTDETWGVRKLVPIIPLLCLPVGFLWKQWRQMYWFTKSVVAVIIVASVCVNFLGASYTYARQLGVVRAAGVDSLTTMRYVPAFAHPMLFGTLWNSYAHRTLTGREGVLVYQEPTWFRWIKAGDHDILLRDIRLTLTRFDTPSIIWIHKYAEHRAGIIFLVAAWVGAGISLWFLTKKYS